MIGWRKFAGRAQETLLHWEFDESGDATAMVQLLPTGGPLLSVPLSKCLHFVTVPLKNSPEGRSILRNAYVPYVRKKRIEEIEAIGIERDLAGLPVAWVPPEILKASRKRRIALGAGVQVQEVNRLLNQFEQSQKMMKMVSRGGMGKLMRGMKGMLPGMGR